MNQVLWHILASYKLYFKLVLAYKKLVIRTTQQHFKQTLIIIIHAVLSDRFNLSTRAGIYIPLKFAVFRRFFWRTYRNWFFMRRVFQDRRWSLRLFQPRLLWRRVVWLPWENLTLNRAPISPVPSPPSGLDDEMSLLSLMWEWLAEQVA